MADTSTNAQSSKGGPLTNQGGFTNQAPHAYFDSGDPTGSSAGGAGTDRITGVDKTKVGSNDARKPK